MLEILLRIRLMLKYFSASNATSMLSACVSSRNSSSNASDDDNYDSNDAINENISNDSSGYNYIIRRSFQFPHDCSLVNEWNNYLDLPMLREQQK